jgi:predicted RND superfamily exporter protein
LALLRDYNRDWSLYLYDVSFPLAEQYDQIAPNTIINVAVAGVVMLLTAIVFIPHIGHCVTVSFIVCSINIGVLASLTVWNINLDIISTITILLSIGFSVDFSTHVAYHFYHSQETSVNERLAVTLETVGWPIVQSSLSTLVGVSAMIGTLSINYSLFIIHFIQAFAVT